MRVGVCLWSVVVVVVVMCVLSLSPVSAAARPELSRALENLETDLGKMVALEEDPDDDKNNDPLRVIEFSADHAGDSPTRINQISKYFKYISLLFSENIKGKIENDPNLELEPGFSGVNAEERLYLLRMLWWGSQYAYVSTNHYRATPDGPPEVVVVTDEVNRAPATKNKNKKPVVEARAVFIDAQDFKVGDEFPSRWYCQRAGHTLDFCEQANIIHIAFRGLQLSWDLTTPPVDDLVNMRGRTKIITCDPQIVVNGGGDKPFRPMLKITEGTCMLLKSLVARDQVYDAARRKWVPSTERLDWGLFEILMQKIEDEKAQGEDARPILVYFQGLSFGGALAQAAGVLFAQIVEFLGYDDVRASIVTFGAPRVGANDFVNLANSHLKNRRLTSDQFIMYTFFNNRGNFRAVTDTLGLTRKSDGMYYDPIAMWPPELHPIGRQHTLFYGYRQEGSEGHVITLVNHDMQWDATASYHVKIHSRAEDSRQRKVPVSSLKTFYCLHLFPFYKKFFESVAALRIWCTKSAPAQLNSDRFDISAVASVVVRELDPSGLIRQNSREL